MVKSISIGESKNPMELAKELNIELRDIQNNALESFEGKFDDNNKHYLITMPTGSGKTRVGLLIAEHLRRQEEGKKVLYACLNNQLVEQVAEEAKKINIEYADRTKGKFDPEDSEFEYSDGSKLCITNYHSLLHKNSIFSNTDYIPDIVIFDDAHKLTSMIRDQCSIKIDKHDNSSELKRIMQKMWSRYYKDQNSFDDTSGYIPNHIVKLYKKELKEALEKTKIMNINTLI